MCPPHHVVSSTPPWAASDPNATGAGGDASMSGFERILARVGGDALRDYCSSAIEDELRSLKGKMEGCLAAVEQALQVQDAILKLDVPLDDSAAAFKSLQKEFKRFHADLDAFVAEQNRIQEESGIAEEEEADKAGESTQQQVAKLLGKIQHRITRKRSDAWVDKSFKDVQAVAELVKREDYGGPDKPQRHEMVLVLDHLISAVLLSPLATFDVLAQLESVLASLLGVHKEIDEYIQSSNALLATKRAAFAPPSSSNVLALPTEEPPSKRQRTDTSGDTLFVKSERLAELSAAVASSTPSANTPCEVYVSDLPWGAKSADVESFFGIAGKVESVRMPTMDDGSTVGVAVVRFANFEGMSLALRMNGYPFNGKTIRVTVSRSN